MKLPTVTIDLEGEPYVINQADYDPDVHTLYDADAADAGTKVSKAAREVLADAGLDESVFDGMVPSGARGFTKADAEAAVARVNAEE